ncbi:MAG: hypothetical protein RLP02_17505 [Coleofasciculus sp. C2-GNP5-27]
MAKFAKVELGHTIVETLHFSLYNGVERPNRCVYCYNRRTPNEEDMTDGGAIAVPFSTKNSRSKPLNTPHPKPHTPTPASSAQ